MTLRFLVDAQLPPGLAVRLREMGHEADHVDELDLRSASDAMIWRHVCKRFAVLITKDQDFVGAAKSGVGGGAVIWIRLGNTTNNALWEALEPLLPEIMDALRQGEQLIEIK